MPIERIFNDADAQRLLDMNSALPCGGRNSALIMGALYWGLTPTELSLLRLEDVMDQSGEFFRIWTLPDTTAYNGESRELHTEDHVLPFFEQYMNWRVAEGLFKSNQSWYRGSNPRSQFFVNDRGQPFKLSPRKKGGDEYQPRSMTAKLKSFIKMAGIEGATAATYRDSFVKAMHDNGCHHKDLMRVTGIKQKETIDRKIRPQIQDLDKVFKSVFSRVKVTD
ncbi:site-specific integrase [Marinobacter gelidimuriae]|uniref:site-specific integrase n=1 Tax=Marinobacter gelidimuriae TaxID=2739064 RepID=UPI000365420D|nr:site-specific integrase [Marinobacter gelidimuriae]